MARALALGVALLAARGCLCSGPDDEQVLVQRAAVVQHGVEVHDFQAMERQARQVLIENVHKLTAKAKEAAQKMQAKIPPIGEEDAVCTPQQMSDYAKAVKEFKNHSVHLHEAYVHDSLANATRVVLKHVSPLINATKRIAGMSWSAVKPQLRHILQGSMFKAMKPRTKYSAADVGVDVSTSEKAIQKALEDQVDTFTAILSKVFVELDATLNRTVEEIPNSAQLKSLIRMSGLSTKWDGPKNEDIPKYMFLKVAPILAAEVFPVFAMPLSLMNKLPKDPQDFLPFAMTEVFPVIDQMTKKLNDDAAPFQVEKGDVPKRLCHTCQEKYASGVNDAGDNGCFGSCMSVLNTCITVVDGDCVQDMKKCLQCNTEHLAAFDNCVGNATHAKSIGKFQRIVKMLDTATTPKTFDAFLDGLSQVIIDG